MKTEIVELESDDEGFDNGGNETEEENPENEENSEIDENPEVDENSKIFIAKEEIQDESFVLPNHFMSIHSTPLVNLPTNRLSLKNENPQEAENPEINSDQENPRTEPLIPYLTENLVEEPNSYGSLLEVMPTPPQVVKRGRGRPPKNQQNLKDSQKENVSKKQKIIENSVKSKTEPKTPKNSQNLTPKKIILPQPSTSGLTPSPKTSRVGFRPPKTSSECTNSPEPSATGVKPNLVLQNTKLSFPSVNSPRSSPIDSSGSTNSPRTETSNSLRSSSISSNSPQKECQTTPKTSKILNRRKSVIDEMVEINNQNLSHQEKEEKIKHWKKQTTVFTNDVPGENPERKRRVGRPRKPEDEKRNQETVEKIKQKFSTLPRKRKKFEMHGDILYYKLGENR